MLAVLEGYVLGRIFWVKHSVRRAWLQIAIVRTLALSWYGDGLFGIDVGGVASFAL